MAKKIKNPKWFPASEYRTNVAEWWIGRRVKLLREITTRGGDVYRKGRIVRVDRKFGGLTLTGRNMIVTRVGYHGLMVDLNNGTTSANKRACSK